MPKRTDTALLLRKLKISWRKALLRLIPLGGFSCNNTIEIFHDGDNAFSSIFEAIATAKKSIFIETFIFASDRVGLRLRELLIAAKMRGVVVNILFDFLGSTGLTRGFLQPMADVGIKIVAFNPIWPWRRRGPMLFRDHRKIIVIDEEIAFCGSMNISADYAGPIHGNDRFRDTLARVAGPAVKDLLAITRESIAESEFDKLATHGSIALSNTSKVDAAPIIKLFFRRLRSNKRLFQVKPDHNGTMVQVLRSNQRRNLLHIQKSMEEIVNRAVSHCYFTTPYFLPLEGLRKALINAQLRGVDVRVLTSGISDIPLLRYAGNHVYRSLLSRGIRIYEMTEKTLHAKIATLDGVYSSIGSYNLDHWSERRNLEVNLFIIDQKIAQGLKEQFMTDLALSKEIDRVKYFARALWRRFMCWLAYLLLRL